MSSKSSTPNLDIATKLNVRIFLAFSIKILNSLKEILNYKLFSDCDSNFLSCMDMKEAHDASTDFGEPKEEEKDKKFKTDVSLEEVNLTGGNTN